MDAAGLLLGGVALAPKAMPWLGREHAIALVVAVAALSILAGVLLHRHWRQRASHGGTAGDDGVRRLKQRLRQRLAEPAEIFASAAVPGPTLGAGEVVEADLDAAARAVLPEAGWRCGAAKHLLRKRIDGHAPDSAANGAEAAHWRQLGALALLDDTHDALAAYARAAALSADDPDLQMLLGVLQLRSGQPEVAEAAFRGQLDLANGKDGSAAIRCRAGAMLGDALLAKGARENALAAYAAALKEALALAEREPANARWRRHASVLHDRVGDVLLGDGQTDLALASFQSSLEIAETLARGDAASPALQHDLSVAHDRVGEALELKGDLDDALKSYRSGLAVAEAVAKLEPDRLDWRWDVSASLDRIGDVQAARGKPDKALAAYRGCLEIAEALAARDPLRLHWQRDLAVTCHKIGLLEIRCGREAEAREALERGRAIVARLAHIARYQAQWRSDLSKFDAALRTLGP
jgi:predicted negative regulator of RcsB-dependent stress response